MGTEVLLFECLKPALQKLLETDHKASQIPYFSDSENNARHKRTAVDRVVPEREYLPDPAKDDLLMGDKPGQAYAVDRHISRDFIARAACTRRLLDKALRRSDRRS